MAAISSLEAMRSTGSATSTKATPAKAKSKVVKKITTSGGTPVKKHSKANTTTTKKVASTSVRKTTAK